MVCAALEWIWALNLSSLIRLVSFYLQVVFRVQIVGFFLKVSVRVSPACWPPGGGRKELQAGAGPGGGNPG